VFVILLVDRTVQVLDKGLKAGIWGFIYMCNHGGPLVRVFIAVKVSTGEIDIMTLNTKGTVDIW
jgi:hypothetical protein